MRSLFLAAVATSALCISQSTAQNLSSVEINRAHAKGDSCFYDKRYPEAVSFYEHALKQTDRKKPDACQLLFNTACAYFMMNDERKAAAYLTESLSVMDVQTLLLDEAIRIITAASVILEGKPNSSRTIQKYFPPSLITYALNEEISFETLNDVLTIWKDWRAIAVRKKKIFWQRDKGQDKFNSDCLPWDKGVYKRITIFEDCRFKLNFRAGCGEAVGLWSMRFERCEFLGSFQITQDIDFSKSKPNLRTRDFYFENGDFLSFKPTDRSGDFRFSNSKFSSDFWLISNTANLHIEKCEFGFAYVSLGGVTESVEIRQNTATDSSDFRFLCNYSNSVIFDGNSFAPKTVSIANSKISNLRITESEFRNFLIDNTQIQSEFDFYKSSIANKVLFRKCYFNADPVNDIDFQPLSGNRFGALSGEIGYSSNMNENLEFVSRSPVSKLTYVSIDQPETISNDQSFRELLGQYSSLLNLYKSKSDLENYNSCFVQVKELQTKRLKYLYESNPSFERYFRWRLAQLLKFYVRYGTDPARAIVISIYIIISFGIFFFFFPSDWDVTSKRRLIANFKDFVQKNEKGYVRPFFILVGGFIISMINAITLSLNAFITLGFGNIPTRGIARYFCVLEGFLGWFLLSIFTVAMINQVL